LLHSHRALLRYLDIAHATVIVITHTGISITRTEQVCDMMVADDSLIETGVSILYHVFIFKCRPIILRCHYSRRSHQSSFAIAAATWFRRP
jgi:hypothetical protein